jgi:hypothetical protein
MCLLRCVFSCQLRGLLLLSTLHQLLHVHDPMNMIDPQALKQFVLDALEHDKANLGSYREHPDLERTRAYHMGRLMLLRDFHVITKTEHDLLEIELLRACVEEADKRDDEIEGSPLDETRKAS